MTIETVVSKTIQSGNGSNKDFDFAFEIPDEDSLSLTKRGSDGTETTISSNYSVTGIGDEAGGTVTYPVTGSALSSSEKIIIKRVVSVEQNVNLRNQGDYSLEDIEDALDYTVMICQQLQEQIDRAVLLNLSSSQSGVTLDDLVSNRLLVVSADGTKIEMSSAEYGSIDAYLSTLVAIADDISAVAAIDTDVSAVAAINSAVLSCAANMTSIQNAASFGFPTLTSTDVGKMLQVNSTYNGYNAVESLSRKNAIINGDFNIWQRGASFVSVADQQYTADRWIYAKSGAMVHDVSRTTDVPTVAQAGRAFNYSLLIDCQTIDNSIAATDYCVIEQRIEGYNFLPIAQRPLTLSFWVKATKTGIYSAYIKNTGGDKAYVSEFTINSSDTWEFKTINFPASPAAGAWNYVNGIGLSIGFTLACGLNLQTTAGAWQNNGAIGSANQTNACDNVANNFRLCGIQLEVGSIATPFEQRLFNQELNLCQRYYEKSYNYGTAIGTVTDDGRITLSASSSGAVVFTTPFKVSKRTNPTCVFYSNGSGASGNVRNESTASDVAASPAFANDYGLGISKGGLTSGHVLSWHFTANAEL